MNSTSVNRFKKRLLQSTALIVFVTSSVAAQAQTANTTVANVNVLNLLSPFLGLNATAIGQATLQANLQQSININNGATLAQQQLAISDKNLLGSASNTVTGLAGKWGVAANLAGGLPRRRPRSAASRCNSPSVDWAFSSGRSIRPASQAEPLARWPIRWRC